MLIILLYKEACKSKTKKTNIKSKGQLSEKKGLSFITMVTEINTQENFQ